MPIAVLVVAALLVAVSVVAAVHGASDGTMAFIAVAALAMSSVAKITSPMYAHHHQSVVLAVAVLFNVVIFLVPAVPAFLVLRKRRPIASLCTTVIWCAFYVACILVLFPITDGR